MSKIIRILYIIDGLRSGGKERQLLETIKTLDKANFLTGVITFNSGQHYSNKVKENSNYFKELKKRPFHLEPLFTIWNCFHEFKPDIVHTWDTLSSFYSYLPSKYFHIPVINGSIRDAGVDKGLNFYSKKYFLKRASQIISNSYAGLFKYHVDGQVIYNAISTTRFLKPKRTKEFNLIMSANFTNYKDHLTFLKASVKLVQEKNVDHVFLLGEGPNKKKYENWLKVNYPEILEYFHFTGKVGNVEDYLAKCTIGVLCSTQHFGEGLSNSVLEYMAAGLIAIVTNVGGSKEIIDDGINGFLVNPGDHSAIISVVKQIKINNTAKAEISKNAMKTITTKFGANANVQILQNIYFAVNEMDKT